jgi:hypothetical protein
MSGPFDARSGSSWPIITSGALTSRWTRMRRSRGLHNRQPAARFFKCHTWAAFITITNGAPPDDRSRGCQTKTYSPVVRPRSPRLSAAMPTRVSRLWSRVSEDLDRRISKAHQGADGVSGRDRPRHVPCAARRPAQVLLPRGRVALWAAFSHTTRSQGATSIQIPPRRARSNFRTLRDRGERGGQGWVISSKNLEIGCDRLIADNWSPRTNP